jgi:uncharacterized protein (DUF1330 family)
MPAYVIVQIKIIREQGWPEYRAAMLPLMQRFGGRLLVAGAAIEAFEGSHDGRQLAIFEFPSMEAVRSFEYSPEYAEVKKLREGSGELDVWGVPGMAP